MTEAAVLTIERAYRVRLRPTRAQARILRRLMGAKRFVWNWALGESEAAYKATGKRLSLTELSAQFTQLKRQESTAWLASLPREPFNQVLRDLERAYVNAFAKRAAFPVFKRRGTVNALRFTLDQRREQVDRSGSVQLDGIDRVRFKVTETLEGRLRSVTVRLDGAGRWFATFTADGVAAPLPEAPTLASMGLDLGLKDAVALSTGEKVSAPKPLKSKLARLRRYQRRFARQKDAAMLRAGLDPKAKIPKGTRFRRAGDERPVPEGATVVVLSRRSEVTNRKIARLHAQVADQRREFQHQLSRQIVDSAQVICLEDINLTAMAKGFRKAFRRSVADIGLGELRRQIEYKAQWASRTTVRVDRYYPSSKTCSACGAIHATLALSERRWTCNTCGTSHDRDINAAKNIEAEGLRLLGHPQELAKGPYPEERGKSRAQSTRRAARQANGATTGRRPRSANSPKARNAGAKHQGVTNSPQVLPD